MELPFYQCLLQQAREEGKTAYRASILIPNNGQVLLLQHPDELLADLYELPHHSVTEEESLERTITREVRSITGLAVRSITKYLGHLDFWIHTTDQHARDFSFVVDVATPENIRLNGHKNYAWANKETIIKFSITTHTRHALRRYWNILI